MKIRDKIIKQYVDVSCKDCQKFKCYWPRQDPGSFTQGRGYSQRPGGNKGWLCGHREIRGCPENPKLKVEDDN